MKSRRATRKRTAAQPRPGADPYAQASRWLGYAIGAAILVVILLIFLADYLGLQIVVRGLLITLLLINAFWWLNADRAVCQHWSPPRRRLVRCALAIYTGLVCLPVLNGILSRHVPTMRHMPVTVMMIVQLWHILLVVGLFAWPGWIGGRVLLAAVAKWRGRRRRPTKADLARRAFLQRAFVTAPLIITGASSAVGAFQAGRFQINRHRLSLPDWPHDLRGLTITHLSDFHVGRFFRPRHLEPVILAANGLDSDLMVVTGDIVDLSLDVLGVTIDALCELRSRYGVYLVLGNHDLIDDGPTLIREVRAAGLDLLIDQCRRIEIGSQHVDLLGLDWDRGRYDWHVGKAMEGAAGEIPRVALSHHPHGFDALADAGVVLTLAGHTHGGQIMFTSPERPDPIGIGSLVFRYPRGFYRRGKATLFVNAGVGNWFPLRVNAPAEIVQLQIV